MATGTVILPIAAAVMPDGSASNLGPALQRVKSSASAPAPYFYQLGFDASALEQCMWVFRMPGDFASGPILEVQFKMASATTGDVVIEGRLAAVSDGDTVDVDAKTFATANTSAATTVPGVVGYMTEISLALTNDNGIVGGDFTVVYLARDAVNAADTATGDLEIIGAGLTYTTT